jgi:putative endonuclease
MRNGRLMFAEVKTRRLSARGNGRASGDYPLAALRRRQRTRLRRLAVAWLSDGGAARPSARAIRFDAIGVSVDGRDRLVRLEHLEAAW